MDGVSMDRITGRDEISISAISGYNLQKDWTLLDSKAYNISYTDYSRSDSYVVPRSYAEEMRKRLNPTSEETNKLAVNRYLRDMQSASEIQQEIDKIGVRLGELRESLILNALSMYDFDVSDIKAAETKAFFGAKDGEPPPSDIHKAALFVNEYFWPKTLTMEREGVEMRMKSETPEGFDHEDGEPVETCLRFRKTVDASEYMLKAELIQVKRTNNGKINFIFSFVNDKDREFSAVYSGFGSKDRKITLQPGRRFMCLSVPDRFALLSFANGLFDRMVSHLHEICSDCLGKFDSSMYERSRETGSDETDIELSVSLPNERFFETICVSKDRRWVSTKILDVLLDKERFEQAAADPLSYSEKDIVCKWPKRELPF